MGIPLVPGCSWTFAVSSAVWAVFSQPYHLTCISPVLVCEDAVGCSKSVAKVEIKFIVLPSYTKPSNTLQSALRLILCDFSFIKFMLTASSHLSALNMFGNAFHDYSLHHLPRDKGDADWPIVLPKM